MKFIRLRVTLAVGFSVLSLFCGAVIARRGAGPAQSPTFRISQIALPANDLVYHASSNTIFASVPSAAGPRGNTITGVNPNTGEIVSSVFIGSEPNQMALSDDGKYIYVALDSGAARTNTVNSSNGGFLLEFANANTLFAYENGIFSGPRLFRLSLDSAGLSVAQSVNNLPPLGAEIKFSGGLLYTSSGKVINPDTLTVAGDITDQGLNALVTTDANAGRVFYLTGNGAIRTLRAFNLITLNSRGSLDIPGVVGIAGSLIRWGANGFAFGASGGQVFLIQTLLVPSSEPIPDPSPTPPPPTPTPTPITTVRQINLLNNDIVYDAARQIIYASVPSAAGLNGNSLAPIDPATGVIGQPIFVGSEPGKLAISDDQRYLYVALDGAGSVRRFDLATRAPGPQFYAGAPFRVNALEVLPGKPESVAVVQYRLNSAPAFESLAIYDNGARRDKAVIGFGGPGAIAFGATADEFYGNDLEVANGFYKLAIVADGVTAQPTSRGLAGGEIEFANGLIYAANGQVLEPETLTLRGRVNASGPVSPDVANNRVYYLTGNGTARAVRAFAPDTLTPTGLVNVATENATPASLLRWGANGLAFRTSRRIYLIQTSLVPSSAPVPPPAPITAPPAPAPSPVTTVVRQINLAANDLVYDPAGRVIYASVPANGGERANSLTPILPETGVLRAAIPLGAVPTKLAISDDGQMVYVALNPPNAGVRRFNTAQQSLSPPFSLGMSSFGQPAYVRDMKVAPGQPQTLAVARDDELVAIFDNGVARPNLTSGSTRIGLIEFGAAPTTLYGYNLTSGGGLVRVTVNESGASVPANGAIGIFTGYDLRMRFEGGLLYSSYGLAVDPEMRRLAGSYFTPAGPMPPHVISDAASGRVFFITGLNATSDFDNDVKIRVYDQRSFLPLQTINIPGVRGVATSFIRWGANGMAFSTTGGQVFLINTSALTPNNSNLPAAPVSVSAASFLPGAVARDSIVAAFGVNLSNATQAATTLPLPTTLAGTTVRLRDEADRDFPVPLFFVSPGQINFHLPPFFQPGPCSLSVTGANGFVFTAPITVADVAPGLFTANATGQGVAAAVALRIKADGTQSFEPVAEFNAAQNRFVSRPIDLGPASDQVFLILFGTGIRNRSALSAVNARIGGENAEVLFAGPQGGFVGLDQINLRLPRSLAGRGEVEIVVTVNERTTNTVRAAFGGASASQQ
ncbi:MAG: hypothetical protein ACREBD_04105 [Blastocatellia bacterium]